MRSSTSTTSRRSPSPATVPFRRPPRIRRGRDLFALDPTPRRSHQRAGRHGGRHRLVLGRAARRRHRREGHRVALGRPRAPAPRTLAPRPALDQRPTRVGRGRRLLTRRQYPRRRRREQHARRNPGAVWVGRRLERRDRATGLAATQPCGVGPRPRVLARRQHGCGCVGGRPRANPRRSLRPPAANVDPLRRPEGKRTFLRHARLPARQRPRDGDLGRNHAALEHAHRPQIGRPTLVTPSPVSSIAFHQHVPFFATTGGSDGLAKLWSTSTLRQFGSSFPREQGSWGNAEFTPDGSRLVVIWDDGHGDVWPTNVRAWEQHACLIAGRQLAREEWARFVGGRAYAPACP